jgi:hypothetical protein
MTVTQPHEDPPCFIAFRTWVRGPLHADGPSQRITSR